jgi:hypothetical protein
MLPESGAAVAHGSSVKFTVPVIELLFCVIEALPGYVFPLADDVTVNCQVPLSGFEDEEDELLPQPAIQLHSNISTSIFFTTLLRSGVDNCGPCNAQTLQAIWECVQLLMVVTVATCKGLKALPISKYLCLLRSRHASLDDQRRRRRVLGGARRASNRDGVGASRGATSSAATAAIASATTATHQRQTAAH